MSECLQQGGEVVEVDLLEVVSHCIDQAALSVSASHVVARLCGVDDISNTCAGSWQNVIPVCVLFFRTHYIC